MSRKLTANQESYKNERIKGLGPSDAYKASNYKSDKMSDQAIATEAQKLEKHPYISLMIKESKQQASNDAVCTAQWVAEQLKGIAQTAEEPTAARVSALKVLSDYTGEFDKNKKTIEIQNTEELTPWTVLEAGEDG